MEKNEKINSIVIPFVGTLNDDDVASPVFYMNENQDLYSELVETPEIQHRKEMARHYLRHLPVRFLTQNGEKQKMLLYAIFVTRDWRPVDATNILDLIQNAGNRIIWDDDCQFIGVGSQRMVEKHIRPEIERTVVYIKALSKKLQDKLTYRSRCFNQFIDDYRNRYDLWKNFLRVFDTSDVFQFKQKGFWVDKRFLKIPALVANYQQWLIKKYGGAMDHIVSEALYCSDE